MDSNTGLKVQSGILSYVKYGEKVSNTGLFVQFSDYDE